MRKPVRAFEMAPPQAAMLRILDLHEAMNAYSPHVTGVLRAPVRFIGLVSRMW